MTSTMPSSYKCVVLSKRPKGSIVTGETFRMETRESPREADLQDGEVIFQTFYLSADPAMRGWLDDVRSYSAPVGIGEIMRSFGLGMVVSSKSKALPTGTYVAGLLGWTEYGVMKDNALQKIELPRTAKLTDVMGVLGPTGMTAYFGITDVAKVKAGDFVVVSGAAGATGSVACQIAKALGATVVGIAGSDEKCSWLKQLGCDEALNYKDPAFREKFKKATPKFIDVYFDNVGGEILDMALARANVHARFTLCGGISQYNSTEKQGPRNYLNIITMRIRMEGFLVTDYAKEFPKAQGAMAGWMAEGKLSSKETVVKGGLEKAEETLKQLFDGKNMGKMMLEVRAPPEAAVSASL